MMDKRSGPDQRRDAESKTQEQVRSQKRGVASADEGRKAADEDKGSRGMASGRLAMVCCRSSHGRQNQHRDPPCRMQIARSWRPNMTSVALSNFLN